MDTGPAALHNRSMVMSRGWLVLLTSVALLQACDFEDPNEKAVIGSCRTERANEPGIIEHCVEYFERRKGRDAEADNCYQSSGVWSDDPCPTETACGHCIQQRSTESQTTCWYPREDDPISETVLQEDCEDPELDNTWVDNPDVSCD
jgi:hypothetical protein